MDWWKVAIIVVVLGLTVAFLAQLSGVDLAATAGTSALTQLATPAQVEGGGSLDWSPASVFTELVPTLFEQIDTSLGVDVVAIIRAAFGAILLVVGVAVAIKFLTRIAA